MRIHAPINERTVHRTFREKKPGRYGLTVRDLPVFGFTVAGNGTKTFFVRASRPVGTPKTVLGTAEGTAEDMTAAEAREKPLPPSPKPGPTARPARCSPTSRPTSYVARGSTGSRPRGRATPT